MDIKTLKNKGEEFTSQYAYLVEVEHKVQLTHIVEILIQHLPRSKGAIENTDFQFNQIRIQTDYFSKTHTHIYIYLNVMH